MGDSETWRRGCVDACESAYQDVAIVAIGPSTKSGADVAEAMTMLEVAGNVSAMAQRYFK